MLLSVKITDYVTIFREILNPNFITGSKVTAILLNGLIFPIGGASSGRVCAQPVKQACFIIMYILLTKCLLVAHSCICFTATIFLIMTCYQLHATFYGSKWCLGGNTWHWGNINKLYRLYTFFREWHHFVLYVLNGVATLWHKLHKVYAFLTVNRQTNKCCLQKQQHPNHAWGSVWLFYDMQCVSGRQQWGQFGVAVFYSRANHIHSVWVRWPGMHSCSD